MSRAAAAVPQTSPAGPGFGAAGEAGMSELCGVVLLDHDRLGLAQAGTL